MRTLIISLITCIVISGMSAISTSYAQYSPIPLAELLPPICLDANTTANCDSLEQFLNKAIYSPMKKTDVVFVGKIIEVSKNTKYDYPEYNISVEYYLKNPKPQDLLHVADSVAQPKTQSNVFYETEPVFKKGDRLFVYLDDNDGKYSLLPYSFIIPEINGGPHDPVRLFPLKEKYLGDKTITISGGINKGYIYKLSENGANPDIRVRILDPNSNVYKEAALDVNPAGAFYYDFDIFQKYPRSGMYDVFIVVGSTGTGISFEYVSSVKISEKKWEECIGDFQLITKVSDGSINCVKQESAYPLMLRGWAKLDKVFVTNVFTKNPNYNIENGRLISTVLSDTTRSLIFNIESFDDGTLTVSIPRHILDARLGPDGYSGEDDSFIVLVDGIEVDFDETKDATQRILTINFPTGAKTIEVIATYPL